MPEEHLQLLILAALIHDVGKLLERGEAPEFTDTRQDQTYMQFCPLSPEGNYHTHIHVAYTRAFCDWLEGRFDCLRQIQAPWKDWAAAHHRKDESGLESSVIRRADRLSSRERESGHYYIQDIQRRTLLEPVLERVFIGCHQEALSTKWRYQLRPLTPAREDLFPKYGPDLGLPLQEDADQGFSNPKQWKHLLAPEPLIEEYTSLAQGLLQEIQAVASKRPDLDLLDLLETLYSLIEKYTANVPSATNLRHPDISLFDHLRSTAAIAQALYLTQHDEQHSSTRNLENDSDPKWLLACGDFSGIQKFIFNLTNKGAAKGLRGRSFYVQYFCLICAKYILKKLGLHKAALLYNSGGKFYLLIPRHLRSELQKARTEINSWLLSEFGSQVYLGLGLAEVSGEMFIQGRMDAAWKATAEDLELDRLSQFKPLLDQDFFQPWLDVDPSRSCEVCGSRHGDIRDNKCATCLNLQNLGSWLRQTRAILTIWGDKEEAERIADLLNSSRMLHFENLGAHAFLLDQEHLQQLQALDRVHGECAFINPDEQLRLGDLPLPSCACTRMYLGKWEAMRDQEMEFENFAQDAKGISRLGVLRMDVDNLGQVFIQGLRFPERDETGWGEVQKDDQGRIKRRSMASISRMVTLSRQLNMFFSGYISRLLQDPAYSNCRTIYAGGDDLFIIGSWHQLPGLARQIREDFSKFCCKNPDFTISGGLTLHREKFPIYKAAVQAGEAEGRAKEIRKQWGQHSYSKHKDGFCFINVPIVWEDMHLAEEIKKLLAGQIKDNEGKGFLSFLGEITAKNKAKTRNLALQKGMQPARAWQEVAYDSWRWRTAYQLKRRYSKESQEETRQKWAQILFNDTLNSQKATLPVFSWLEFPIRWADYLHR
ncbi:MAG: type III-A CRISPR-associated protein Cas10/Csm1 [Desulfohalobiaceae bacterium]